MMNAAGRLVGLAALAMVAGCARVGTSASATAAPSPARYGASPLELARIRAEVAATLEHGARAWNAGALDEFLSDYVPDTSTTFVTSRGVLHGPSAIRSVYAARFAPGGVRDSLHFAGLEVDVLAPDVVNAIAYYVLMRGDSVTARGPTSLVMRRTNGRWRIAHDHSS